MQEAINSSKEKTDKPFGVNLLLALPERKPCCGHYTKLPKPFSSKSLDSIVTTITTITCHQYVRHKVAPSNLQNKLPIVFDKHVPLLVLGMGYPDKVSDQAHNAGTKVMSIITTTEEAVCAAKGGVNIIVAQESWLVVTGPHLRLIQTMNLHLSAQWNWCHK